jgi:hypothetical protein
MKDRIRCIPCHGSTERKDGRTHEYCKSGYIFGTPRIEKSSIISLISMCYLRYIICVFSPGELEKPSRVPFHARPIGRRVIVC